MGCWDTITHVWMCSNHWAIQTLTQGDSHTECLAFQWAAEIPSHRSGRCSNHWAIQTLTEGDSHTAPECLAFQWAAEIPSHRSGCVLYSWCSGSSDLSHMVTHWTFLLQPVLHNKGYYVLSCLWGGAHKRTLLLIGKNEGNDTLITFYLSHHEGSHHMISECFTMELNGKRSPWHSNSEFPFSLSLWSSTKCPAPHTITKICRVLW